jgi:hypothetical protein
VKKMTAKEVAEKYDVAKRIVQGWCERGLLIGAKKVPSGFGFDVWEIPESALKDFTPPSGRGRPRVANPSKVTLAKRKSRGHE